MNLYGYGSRGSAIAMIIGVLLALAGTIVACILIVPAKRREEMTNKFLIFLHDLFNFKQLFIELILKFIYIFATLAIILIGFCTLFTRNNNALVSFIMMILGPIFIRIMYEFVMLTILLVKNTIEINAKLPNKASTPKTPKAEPAMTPTPAPVSYVPPAPAPVSYTPPAPVEYAPPAPVEYAPPVVEFTPPPTPYAPPADIEPPQE